jgi:hypothetical protein
MTEADICFADENLITSEALNKAFTTALLLTRSVEQSEAALREGIECLDFDDDAAGEKLIRGALYAAMSRSREDAERRPGEVDDALSLLPLELKRVALLPAALRHCFALRVLAGLPRKVCASLLNLEISQVAETAALAAQMLARDLYDWPGRSGDHVLPSRNQQTLSQT